MKEILESPKVFGPLTKLQCCPTSDGSAAAILASEKFVLENNLQDQAIEIVGMEMASDPPTTFSGQTCVQIVSYKCDITICIQNKFKVFISYFRLVMT